MCYNEKIVAMSITFFPLQISDLPLLHQWFQEPIVKKWYAREFTFSAEAIREKYLPRILEQEAVPSFIVQINENPIGFIQYYALTNYLPEGINKENALFHLAKPHQIAGIDFFIGESLFRGRGIGTKILQQFIASYLEQSFSIVVVDPEINNQAAIHFYQKNGFTLTDYSETPEYVILLKACGTGFI